ncbi:MAG: dolichyl-phosphate beta-glucosyltransferase [Candidatus Aminicenantales bacterium]
MNLSIVIPVFNEEARLSQAVEAFNAFLPGLNLDTQVIFVDDGSTDRTAEMLSATPARFAIDLISYRPNRGKGFALRQGILKASGDYVLFLDVDMSTPLAELAKFREAMDRRVPVIIGSRRAAGSRVLKSQSTLRRKLGEGFSFLSSLLLVPGITDFTCGFKMFRRDAARRIFGVQQIERWGFDAEILFLARRYGYAIQEIPVSWTNDERTKVRLLKDVARSFTDLLRIRFNALFRKY